MSMDVEPVVLAERGSSADSLVSTNNPDDLVNEQTWPTEEEMQRTSTANATGALPDAPTGTTPKSVRRVPKGTSEYQAAWIIDSDGESEGDSGEEGGEVGRSEVEMRDIQDEEMEDMVVEDEHEIDIASRKSVAFQDLDIEEEAKQLGSSVCVNLSSANYLLQVG